MEQLLTKKMRKEALKNFWRHELRSEQDCQRLDTLAVKRKMGKS
jgi:hypothetical protein